MVADLLMTVMLAEGVTLTLIYKRTRKGIAPIPLFCSLAAGLFLVLALRAVLVGASWQWVAASLVGALIAHVADICVRWQPKA